MWVNGDGNVYRRGEYWRKELAINNASGAVWQGITNAASLLGTNQTNTGNLFLPKTAENLAYDADGNLTSDGRWTNKWDGENRLIDTTSHSSGPSGSRKSLQFAYDSQGRRYSKIVSNWTGSAWTRALHENYLYDSWNLLGVLNGTNNAILKSFLWGSDLSGGLQGAGGVGGLIAFKSQASPISCHFVAYDGNGNVTVLVDGSTGAASARYEYDPFGQTIRASGTAAAVNPVRFSSKHADDETDLAYYGYRYLQPSAGRWLSRDPIGEEDAPNVNGFVGNNSVNQIDPFGLWTTSVHHKIIDDWLKDPIWDRYYWRCCKTIPVRALLKSGSDQIDGVGNHIGDFFVAQATPNAYQHAMRAPGEDVSVAEAKYKQFIKDSLDEAKRLSDVARTLPCASAPVNLVYQAVSKIGNAFHAISDNQSPPHAGFQLWTGGWTPAFVTEHTGKENLTAYPFYKVQVVSSVDSELTPYLNYVLAIQVQ